VRRIPHALPLNSMVLGYLLDPLLVIGIGMQIFWLLARMALLSMADLSYVLPVTASGYVISAFLGRVYLHEHISAMQWVGILMIFAGASLSGTTPRIQNQDAV
jgi:drug/metabolite transporter (DMT)-like permease